MTYFDKYKNWVLTGNENEAQAKLNRAIYNFNDKFPNSPSYKRVKVNGVESDAHQHLDETTYKAKFTFRPSTDISIGSLIEDANDVWMAFEFLPHKIAPLVKAKKCTDHVVMKRSDGSIARHPCVVDVGFISTKNYNEWDIDIPDGKVMVYVQSNPDTANLRKNFRLILGRQAYEVLGINDIYRVGIIGLECKPDLIRPEDDLDSGLAYNEGSGGNDGGGELPW